MNFMKSYHASDIRLWLQLCGHELWFEESYKLKENNKFKVFLSKYYTISWNSDLLPIEVLSSRFYKISHISIEVTFTWYYNLIAFDWSDPK